MYLENQLAAIGGIKFDNVVDTAGINLDGMHINPNFYATLNDTEKQFLIEHELLHLVLKHHERFDLNQQTNIAADLAINSMLQRRFCGDRDPAKIIPRMYETGCFPSKMGFPEDQTTDWYLGALEKEAPWDLPQLGFGSPLDPKLGELGELLDLSGILAGDSSLDTQVKDLKKREKYTFAHLVQSLVGNKSYRSDFGFVEKIGRNRRFKSLLPSTVLGEGDLRVRKNKVLLFLDFSGSCRMMIGDFVNAANQIPKNLFEIVKFKFATVVVPFDSDNCGGGTSFEEVRKEVSRQKNYDMVWMFTDGESSFYRDIPNPEKWHWFLSGTCERTAIHKLSKVHYLDKLKKKER
jgi:hypothetical protein